MDSKSMTRKDFFVLTFSLVGSAVVASNCSSSNGGGGTGGASGTGGKVGTGGATGTGGRGTGGAPADAGGTGGAPVDAAGTGGRIDSGGDTGPGDVPVTPDSGPVDSAPIDTTNNCLNPLSEEQFQQAGDNGNHTHTLIVPASTLNATTAQTLNTESAGAGDGHIHGVTFSAADLATLRAGGIVEIRSAVGANHTHSYRVGCHALPDGATDTGPADATVG